jgi:hypothetical protein
MTIFEYINGFYNPRQVYVVPKSLKTAISH